MDKIGEQLPTLGITAASLTLVFLGFLLASFEGFTAEARSTVAPKFRRRGWLAVGGIACALVSAVLGAVSVATVHSYRWVDAVGIGCLGLWTVLTAAQAINVVLELK